MRNIPITIAVLFFLFSIKTDAAGISDLNYQFYCFSNPGPEKVEFEILIKNDDDIPVHFEFPTSKLYDISVLNKSGEEVYLHSKGRHFLQAFQTVTVEPHKTFKRIEKWNYLFNGKRISKGEYTVNGVLLPTSINGERTIDRSKLKCSTKMLVPEENQAFHHVSKGGLGGNYQIKGETNSKVFFYTVEDGHRQIIKEQRVIVENPNSQWIPFSIQLKILEKELPKNGSLIMNLYNRGSDGEIKDHYPILLDRFE
jgi:hypothetical protein